MDSRVHGQLSGRSKTGCSALTRGQLLGAINFLGGEGTLGESPALLMLESTCTPSKRSLLPPYISRSQQLPLALPFFSTLTVIMT